MTSLLQDAVGQSAWQFLSTPPLSGQENMDFDRATAARVREGSQEPTVRFFRFQTPTATYGRLQKPGPLASQVPAGWDLVQRPTGGGLVLHETDLCVSLCWRLGTPPMPDSVREHYRFIHGIIEEGLRVIRPPTMATCKDCSTKTVPFEVRDCFAQPVVFDLLSDGHKIVGGALAHLGRVVLYQGSIQSISDPDLEGRLREVFERRLCLSS